MTTGTQRGVSVERDGLIVQGRERTLLIVRPIEPAPNEPLVVALHGSNQDGAGLRRFAGYGFDRYAREAGATVVYLDGYKRNWNDARRHSDFAARRQGIDDVGFVTAAIERFTSSGEADPRRVFVLGFSAGGSMVLRLLHEIPGRLAAAAVLSATQPVPENFLAIDAPAQAVPVVFFHGSADRLVPYGGGMASLWGFRPRGMGRSAVATAAYYAARNGIRGAPTVEEPVALRSADGARIRHAAFREPGRAPVDLYTVVGGGHVIPGPTSAPRIMGRTTKALDAPAVIGRFFGLLPDTPLAGRQRSPAGA